jgi:apolipoprotein N-acyltransferase
VVGEHSRRNTSIPTYLTPFGRLGTIICLDIDYTNTTRDWARRGAGIIAAPGPDNPGITTLHYTQLALRAAENRVSMVKADLGYDSAIVDPYGRVLKKVETPHKGQALVIGDVAVGSGRTPASRLTDWFGWLAVAGTLVFLVAGLRVRVSSRRVG